MNETTKQELEMVQQGYRAFERGDLSWALEHVDTEILQSWLSAWDQLRMQPTRFIPSGDQILVLVHQIAQGKGSEMEVHEDVAHLWTVRDKMAVGYRVFTNQLDGLAALSGSRTLEALA